MLHEHPVERIVAFPDDVAPSTTDVDTDAPETCPSNVPLALIGINFPCLMRQLPRIEMPAFDRVHVNPLPGLATTDVDDLTKSVTWEC